MKSSSIEAAKRASKALANLNTYAAVSAILEGGTIYEGRHAAATKIIKICKSEMQRELLIYDEAIGNVKATP